MHGHTASKEWSQLTETERLHHYACDKPIPKPQLREARRAGLRHPRGGGRPYRLEFPQARLHDGDCA